MRKQKSCLKMVKKMQGKNHVALALAAPLGAALITGRADILPPTVITWGALIVGSLAPDMDGEGSIAYWGNWLPRYITPWLIRAALNWLGQTVSRVIRAIFGHRNTLHWPILGLFMAAGGHYLGLPWLMWLGIGYMLHIAGDALTKSGGPLFGPFYLGDVSFTPMVTGGFVESSFGVALWVFVGWQLIDLLPQSEWLWQTVYSFGGQILR